MGLPETAIQTRARLELAILTAPTQAAIQTAPVPAVAFQGKVEPAPELHPQVLWIAAGEQMEMMRHRITAAITGARPTILDGWGFSDSLV